MCGLRFMITIFYAFKDTYTSACTSYLQLHVLMLISPRLETMVKKKKKKGLCGCAQEVRLSLTY